MALPDELIIHLTPSFPDLPSSAGNINIVFDRPRYFNIGSLTDNITFVLDAVNSKSGNIQVYSINGANLGKTITFPAGSLNGNGQLYDDTKQNIIYMDFVNGKIIYCIQHDVIFSLYPAFLTNQITGTASTGLYKVKVDKAGFVKWMLTTSATPPSKAQILAGTGAVSTNFGSLTMTANTDNTVSLAGLTALTTYYLYSYSTDPTDANESIIQSAIIFTPVSTAGVVDNFNRITNLTSLGSAPGGSPWNVVNGVWGISGNTAKLDSGSATLDNIALVDGSLSDLTASIDILDTGSTGQVKYNGLIIRYSDSLNYLKVYYAWTVGPSGSMPINLVKVVNGVEISLGGYDTGSPAFAKSLKITVSGSNLNVYHNNGSAIITAIDGFNATATKAGLLSRNADTSSFQTTFDNYSAQ